MSYFSFKLYSFYQPFSDLKSVVNYFNIRLRTSHCCVRKWYLFLRVFGGKQWWLNKYVCIPDHVQLNDMDVKGDFYPKATPTKLNYAIFLVAHCMVRNFQQQLIAETKG